MSTADQIADLDRRLSVQEYLHRFADEKGTIRHPVNMIPFLALATLVGGGITCMMIGDLKSKNTQIFLGACVVATGVVSYLLLSGTPKPANKVDYSQTKLVAVGEPVN